MPLTAFPSPRVLAFHFPLYNQILAHAVSEVFSGMLIAITLPIIIDGSQESVFVALGINLASSIYESALTVKQHRGTCFFR